MKETVERNNRFYTNEKGEIKTENEQLKEWLIIANKENERLNNIINKTKDYIVKEMKKYYGYDKDFENVLSNIMVILGVDKDA